MALHEMPHKFEVRIPALPIVCVCGYTHLQRVDATIPGLGGGDREAHAARVVRAREAVVQGCPRAAPITEIMFLRKKERKKIFMRYIIIITIYNECLVTISTFQLI